MRAAKVQASLRIRTVSPEPPLLAHTSSESRGTFRQKARSLASLNGWACAVKTCRDGMLEDTNSLDGAHLMLLFPISSRAKVNGHELRKYEVCKLFDAVTVKSKLINRLEGADSFRGYTLYRYKDNHFDLGAETAKNE